MPCGRGCAVDADGDPWKKKKEENLGDRASSQRASHPYLRAVNAAAERDPAPVLSRYRRAAKSQREAKRVAANPGKEKARFPFSRERGPITNSAQASLQNPKKKMCASQYKKKPNSRL